MSNSHYYSKKVFNYVFNTKPALNFAALFSDGTEFYRSPCEPEEGEEVTFRFRTATDNVDDIFLIYNGIRNRMNIWKSDDLFDYYEITILPEPGKIEYYFEINAGTVVCYYNKLSCQKALNPDYNYKFATGFKVPNWAKGAVFYQIFVDRFCNGDKSNDVLDNEYCYIGEGTRQVSDWNKYPDNMDVRSFYGGDLQGVINKLDYLKDLGVDVIYLNPIFVSPSNHKYDIQDYDYVDPHFGKIIKDDGECLKNGSKTNKESTRYITRVTDKANLEASNQLFIELVEKVHAKGMKIILDGVFNHCGSFNKWLDKECIYEGQEGYEKGAYVDYESPYRSFFKFSDHWAWPYNNTYNGWWGHDTLPKLNYEESDKLYEYILNIGAKWVSPPFNADGWRLDVAADLGQSEEYNHKFWRDFRKKVKEANPEAIILAEHYGDPKAWLAGDQWDTVMNYDAFMEPITWFLTGVEKHSDEFRGDLLGNPDAFTGALRHHMSRFNQNSLEVAMNELSNHDHSRFLTRTNRKVGRIHTLGPQAAIEYEILDNIGPYIDSSRLERSLKVVGKNASNKLYVNDSTFIIYYDNTLIYSSSKDALCPDSLLEKTTIGQKNYIITTEKDKHYIYVTSCNNILSANLNVVNKREISYSYTLMSKQIHFFRLLLIICLIVCSVFMFIISYFLTKPLTNLKNISESFAIGDYEARANIKSKDEVGDLANTYNKMADAVSHHVKELKEMVIRQDQFVADFTHEIKTPMTAIIGYSDMLRSKEMSKEQQFISASYIFSEGKRLEAMSMKLFDLIYTKNHILSLQKVHIEPLRNKVSQSVSPILSEKNITLIEKFDNYTILGDIDLLCSAFINLIDNARKASSKNSKIIFTGKKTDNNYVITVKDFGRGISPKHLTKVCNEFYMVDKSRSRQEGGAGLGLSLTALIIKKHNATLDISSTLGQGTTITVSFNNHQ